MWQIIRRLEDWYMKQDSLVNFKDLSELENILIEMKEYHTTVKVLIATAERIIEFEKGKK